MLLAAKLVGRPSSGSRTDGRTYLANQARHDIATLDDGLDEDGPFLGRYLPPPRRRRLLPGRRGSARAGGCSGHDVHRPYRIPKARLLEHDRLHPHLWEGAFWGPWRLRRSPGSRWSTPWPGSSGWTPWRSGGATWSAVRSALHAPNGARLRRGHPEETLEQAAEMFDWDAFRASQGPAQPGTGPLRGGHEPLRGAFRSGFRGMGHGEATGRIGVSARSRLLGGSGSHGHSLETTIPQVVADHLGRLLRPRRRVLRQGGDTPYGPGTGAVGRGDPRRSGTVRRRDPEGEGGGCRRPPLEAAPEDLEVSVRRVSSGDAVQVVFAALAGAAYLDPPALPGIEPGLEASRRFAPPGAFTWSNACHICWRRSTSGRVCRTSAATWSARTAAS